MLVVSETTPRNLKGSISSKAPCLAHFRSFADIVILHKGS